MQFPRLWIQQGTNRNWQRHCGATAASEWLKKYHPKLALHPTCVQTWQHDAVHFLTNTHCLTRVRVWKHTLRAHTPSLTGDAAVCVSPPLAPKSEACDPLLSACQLIIMEVDDSEVEPFLKLDWKDACQHSSSIGSVRQWQYRKILQPELARECRQQQNEPVHMKRVRKKSTIKLWQGWPTACTARPAQPRTRAFQVHQNQLYIYTTCTSWWTCLVSWPRTRVRTLHLAIIARIVRGGFKSSSLRYHHVELS